MKKRVEKPTLKSIDEKLDAFIALMTESFVKVLDNVQILTEKVDAAAQELEQVKNDVTEIKETQNAHGKAIDKDAVTIIQQGRRLGKLEKTR